MCILIAEIALLIWGLVVLVRGRFTSGRNEVEGAVARIIGVILMLPLPCALMLGLTIGASMAASGKRVDLGKMLLFSLIDIGLIIMSLIAAYGIAMVASQPSTRKRRRRRRHVEDEDDEVSDRRPRRRRYEEDEDDDEDDRDRPRRRRQREDDDEDDEVPVRRSRRPRPPEDDDDERPRRRPDDRYRSK
jgi:hypothetical protein